jgi:hypothetical protein
MLCNRRREVTDSPRMAESGPRARNVEDQDRCAGRRAQSTAWDSSELLPTTGSTPPDSGAICGLSTKPSCGQPSSSATCPPTSPPDPGGDLKSAVATACRALKLRQTKGQPLLSITLSTLMAAPMRAIDVKRASAAGPVAAGCSWAGLFPGSSSQLLVPAVVWEGSCWRHPLSTLWHHDLEIT